MLCVSFCKVLFQPQWCLRAVFALVHAVLAHPLCECATGYHPCHTDLQAGWSLCVAHSAAVKRLVLSPPAVDQRTRPEGNFRVMRHLHSKVLDVSSLSSQHSHSLQQCRSISVSLHLLFMKGYLSHCCSNLHFPDVSGFLI